jgi:hypothetical protein
LHCRRRTDNEEEYIRLFDAYYKEQEIRTNLHLFSELQLIDLLDIAAPSMRRLEVTCQYHIHKEELIASAAKKLPLLVLFEQRGP